MLIIQSDADSFVLLFQHVRCFWKFFYIFYFLQALTSNLHNFSTRFSRDFRLENAFDMFCSPLVSLQRKHFVNFLNFNFPVFSSAVDAKKWEKY